MRRIMMGVVGAMVSAALVGCNSPPSPERRIRDVARLEAHVVSVIDDLGVRSYLDERSTCDSILYARGEFRDGDESCGSPTEVDVPFDEGVRNDFDRIGAAIEASGVDTHRVDASVSGDGHLQHVSFRLEDCSIEWNWVYLYDPNGAVARPGAGGSKGNGAGAPTYTRINGDWWLVTEIDD